jgi:hypothetical protein
MLPTAHCRRCYKPIRHNRVVLYRGRERFHVACRSQHLEPAVMEHVDRPRRIIAEAWCSVRMVQRAVPDEERTPTLTAIAKPSARFGGRAKCYAICY